MLKSKVLSNGAQGMDYTLAIHHMTVINLECSVVVCLIPAIHSYAQIVLKT